ncbi:hypothetical protein [Micromonospora sp. LOL_021]
MCAAEQVAPRTQYLYGVRNIDAGSLQVDYTVVSWGGNYYPEIRS